MTLWGTGRPRREFLYSDDLADACLFLLGLGERELGRFLEAPCPPLINVGSGFDLSIADLASLVAKVVGYQGHFDWDTSKPDGTQRKLLDVSVLKDLGWRPSIELEQGIRLAYGDYLSRAQNPA